MSTVHHALYCTVCAILSGQQTMMCGHQDALATAMENQKSLSEVKSC